MSQIFCHDDITCPRYYNVLIYPRNLTQISIINQIPLKIEVTFHVFQLNQTFSVSGMVCSNSFDKAEAQTACRSLGHTTAKFAKNKPDHKEEMCTFNYKDQRLNIPCRFILNKLRCSNTTVDLMQCSFDPLFSFGCKNEKYIDLTCTTPISTTQRTTIATLISTTKRTTIATSTSETSITEEV